MLLCLCRGDLLCGQSPLLPAARVASCWYGLIAVKSLLPAIRKRVSLVVTYYQPLSCFIFLRLLLDILLNLFCIFPCCIHAISPTLKLPYQASVPILSASGYTRSIPLRRNPSSCILYLSSPNCSFIIVLLFSLRYPIKLDTLIF